MKLLAWIGAVMLLLFSGFCFNFNRVHLQDRDGFRHIAKMHLDRMTAEPALCADSSILMERAIADAEHYQQLSDMFFYLAVGALAGGVILLGLACLAGRSTPRPPSSDAAT